MVEAALSTITVLLLVFGAGLAYELTHPAVDHDGKLIKKL